MKVRELLAALDGADPDAEVTVVDGSDHHFFDITESEWCHLVRVTWVDDSEDWWPPELLSDEDHALAKAETEHYVLVLR